MPVSILDLLRVFYRTGAAYLPVVDGQRLAGIIGREGLTALASDAARAEQQFNEIGDEFLLSEPYDPDVFRVISSARQCTVLSPQGETSQIESSRILAMIPARKSEAAPRPQARTASEEVNLWLSRLLLASVPFPLYAMDLKGKTLFYNGAFENAVIGHSEFRSVARVEKAFLELSRQLLAESIAQGKENQPMRGMVRQTGAAFWMVTLVDAGRVAGYLFALEQSGVLEQELFQRMKVRGMDHVMDSLEKGVLLQALGQTDYNISQTAGLLQTRRTTLQSRMKRLRLPLKVKSAKKSKPASRVRKGKKPSTQKKAIRVRKKSARKK